ncbi:hypothetical protein Back11_43500 [Paenibacillus baekrokdamisoli]|uniref:NADPH-dependent FMN reductase-like domain-containing protein n=1 Tax=Paenibacillus baekrokdamisoli TaxID=1712516 RepID=A0A3G9J3S7_9BACL|nr:hypothetical protein Back11_43500 [Paenibacillus baekrokdamisoli]
MIDIEWADAIIFSIPTRFGNMPSQMKQFLDTTGGLWFQGKTALHKLPLGKLIRGANSLMNRRNSYAKKDRFNKHE